MGGKEALKAVRRASAAGLAWLLAAAPAWAISSNAGTSAAQFLKLGAGARAGAMAEAQLALADDVHAAYYNPAGLVRSERPMASGMHSDRFQDIDYEFLAFSYPWGEGRHALAASVYNLSVSGIERRTQDTDLAVGSFEASDSAYAVSYGWRATERLGLGGTVKWVRTKLDVINASAVGLDLGLQYRLGTERPLDLAVVLRNAGTKMTFAQGSDPLPLTVGAGAAAELRPGLRAALDVLKSRDTGVYASAGAEYERAFGPSFRGALRGGYTTHFKDLEGLKGVTAGLGLGLGPVEFDFAWIPFGDLGTTLRYSLAVRF